MDDERTDDITEDREEVAEESTPETDVQATEQRTDDYDGIVRRLDDIETLIRQRFDGIQGALDALGVAAVESDGVIDGDVADTIGKAAAEAVDEILGIDSLDLL